MVRTFGIVAAWATATLVWGQSPQDYLAFVRAQAAALRAGDAPAVTREQWEHRNASIRKGLARAWDGWPASPAPLNPKHLGSLARDGYRVEKILFQTLPDVWMTANAYVPDGPGKRAALLMVHGHWRGAKQDPAVQARCIGAVKLGFFVLAVDAFGAGERAVGKALGEYHGEMTAATLFPLGMPLSGIQVYENMRAVDYLRTRPEVDGDKIGVTGASGGGNQTMYAGTWDTRLAAAVPVCSVGNYQAYLGTACCMCEVVPGALRFMEEGDLLGLAAPRGLMVINATKDGIQFSVPEAKKSIARATPSFEAWGKPSHVKHVTFESPHDYNRPMREAMYGWMAFHLKGEGDGSPIAEPKFSAEAPEAIRCYPGESRPADWLTLPKFAGREARKLLAARVEPADAAALKAQSAKTRDALRASWHKVAVPAKEGGAGPDASGAFVVAPEEGIRLPGHREPGTERVALVLDLAGADKARASDVAKALRADGWAIVTCDLRATGSLAWAKERVGNAPDHNSAQWSMWIGRPLLGQWTVDVARIVDTLAKGEKRPRLAVVGLGDAGLVALAAAALDERIDAAVAVDPLATYVTDAPYRGTRMGLMVPGILRDVGDVAHLTSLIAPRRAVVAGGVGPDGAKLTPERLAEIFRPASRAWSLAGAPDAWRPVSATPEAIARALAK